MALAMDISTETRNLLADVHEWAVTHVRPRAREVDDNCAFPADTDEVLAVCPVRHSPLDFRYSGPGHTDDPEVLRKLEGGGDLLGLLVMEEMAYGDGWGWQALPGNNLGERAVRLLGSPEQIDKWADGTLRGEYKFTSICMTEEHCGSDLSQIRTNVARDGDQWVLNGQKRFISLGAISDYLVVFAQTDPGSGLAGIRAFIVDRNDPGLSVVKRAEDKMGTRWYPQAQLQFDNIRLDDDRRLPSDNFGEIMAIMNGTRPYCAAIGIGTARGALDYAWSWVKEHEKGYSSKRWDLLEDQVKEMRHGLDRVRNLVLRAGWRHDLGTADGTFAHVAKGHAVPVIEAVTFRAMQMMGPAGSSKEHLVEKWHRDVKFLDITEGTNQMHRIGVSRAYIGRMASKA
ncbi:acyl-CoA dehydrogenase family protein [Micromonospora olivasterospora]|uniref:Alkylation response protein AidB-like acyl-CoA dehydrogenase n=1 Tax=Micromonospora olivasterospora TaxID=1880 RepID=A0A562I2U5_MICOL|nr:acyl-CoA dehydrogenase family protein [Micromonospora olivasterospora]TWH65320.1 alkylation response protein AidB-like acyl-CoA dehydrogenase [Micromonospora olivasterospora]